MFGLVFLVLFSCIDQLPAPPPGPDLHSGEPRGVCRALLEPRAGEAGGGPGAPHRPDLLRARALPHRQGVLRHRHVGYAQPQGGGGGDEKGN